MDNEATPTIEGDPTPDPIETGAAKFLAAAFDKLQQGAPAEVTPPMKTAAEVVETPPPSATDGPKTVSALDTLANALGPKPEVAPDLDPMSPDNDLLPPDVEKASEKSKGSFRAMKEVIKARTREAEAIKQELEELKKKAITPVVDETEVKTLKERVAEYEQQLKVSNVRATQEYKEAVVEPLERVKEAASKIADKHGLAQRDLADALRETDSEKQAELLGELTAGLPEWDRLRVYELAKEGSRVQALKQRVLANADEALKRIEKAHADEAAQKFEAQSKERTQAIDVVWNQLQEVAPLFRPQEGNDAWNTVVAGLQEEIKTVNVDALNTTDKVRLATRSVVAPVAIHMLNELYAAHQKVVAELDSIKKATPRVGAQSTDPGAPTSSSEDPNMTFAEKIKLSLAGA